MDEHSLKDALPRSIADRLQSVKLANGVATIILDAAGLDAGQRADLEAEAKAAGEALDGIDEMRVALVADREPEAPPAPKPIIVAVGSGKGGVGKSTLTANLAIALKKAGLRVGVVDADVYGPSQPTLLSTKGDKAQARDEKLIPLDSPYGIPVLSMGHLVEPGKALAWRGPMAGNAMGQLVDAHWGDTQILLMDLPPGTGDVQLTMLQRYKPAGAIIVSTPQDLALIDAQRAANLFDSGKVEIIGLVENMAGYECPHCGEVSDPFGRGGVEAASDATDIPFLGRIPLALKIREDSDAGKPPALGTGPEADAFGTVAQRLLDWLQKGTA